MPDLLGVTNPVPGHESVGPRVTPPTPNDTNIQNVVDPNRVSRPDNRTERQDTGDTSSLLAGRYDSNFMTFLQRLQNIPDLSEVYMSLVRGSLQVTSGISSGFAAEISQFLELLQMDEGQLLKFLKNQMRTGTRFGGALFQTLLSAYEGSRSDLVKNDILQFLRRYSDYTSTERLEGKMIRTIADMSQSLPSKWGSRLLELNGQLANGAASGDRAGNLNLLQKELFPLLSRYVSLTHDHGRARNLLSMLTLDVARYENGSEEGLIQSFRHLTASGALPEGLAKLSDEEVLQLLRRSGAQTGQTAEEGNPFADRLAELTHRALQGSGGPEAQDAFRNILSSLLLNESVFMPLNHLMLPVQWEDRAAFSEMWVDPDADRGRGGGSDAGKTTRILIKLDVDRLGAFDVLLNVKKDSASLQVTCPDAVAAFSEEVSRELSGILERNGFRAESVNVAQRRRSMTLTEVFPKLTAKISGINVKV